MNLKKKYPLAWKDFEKWYKNWMPMCQIQTFPFEMQLGVYLKYLDEKGLHILMESVWDSFIFDDEKDIPLDKEFILPPPEDRFDEYKRAIEQAFKIRNEQLKK